LSADLGRATLEYDYSMKRTEQPRRLALYLRESKAANGSTSEVNSQKAYGAAWADANGCVIPADATFVDNNRSASIFTTKRREEYKRLVEYIKAGKIDLIWFWSLSRNDRRLKRYAEFLELCAKQRVKWVIANQEYDPNNPMHRAMLGMSAVQDEVFSLQLSLNVRRGLSTSIGANLRPRGTTYGLVHAHGTQVEDKDQASIVREIIAAVADGKDIIAIKRDLETRGIRNPRGGATWHRSVIRGIAMNRAYIGTLVHNKTAIVDWIDPATGKPYLDEDGEPKRKRAVVKTTEYPGAWGAIVDPKIFWRAQEILSDPKRTTTRPARAVHLLSYIAMGECGTPVQADYDNRKTGRTRNYRCADRCSSCPADELDEYVKAMIDGSLVLQDFQEAMRKGQADSAAVVAARADAARLKVQLRELRKRHIAGRYDLDEYEEIRDGLNARLAAVQRRAQARTVPPVLLDGVVEWSDLPSARRAVAALVEIVLRKAGKGRWHVPIADRVTITPRYQ
jgi:site-specific DNA recombinase